MNGSLSGQKMLGFWGGPDEETEDFGEVTVGEKTFTKYTTTALRLRSGPSTKEDIIKTLPKGSSVTAYIFETTSSELGDELDAQGSLTWGDTTKDFTSPYPSGGINWQLVKVGPTYGWVAMKYLSTTKPKPGDADPFSFDAPQGDTKKEVKQAGIGAGGIGTVILIGAIAYFLFAGKK